MVLTIFIFLIPIILLLLFLYIISKKRPKNEHFENKCSIKSCGALDPVSDPTYNMKNLIKQTILLEEHLAEDNKYCIDCIIKHFLHCQGLIEEGIWLSCRNFDKCPLIEESDELYKKLFDKWLLCKNNKKEENKKEIKYVLEKLREWRKKLVENYF